MADRSVDSAQLGELCDAGLERCPRQQPHAAGRNSDRVVDVLDDWLLDVAAGRCEGVGECRRERDDRCVEAQRV